MKSTKKYISKKKRKSSRLMADSAKVHGGRIRRTPGTWARGPSTNKYR